jgi:hypothetical protein
MDWAPKRLSKQLWTSNLRIFLFTQNYSYEVCCQRTGFECPKEVIEKMMNGKKAKNNRKIEKRDELMNFCVSWIKLNTMRINDSSN